MSQAGVSPSELSDYLSASPRHGAAEAARPQPDSDDPAARDPPTRLLHRVEPDGDASWVEVRRTTGMPVLGDSVPDKPYARPMALVHRMSSGEHHGVVQGVNPLTLSWADGGRHRPCDYRVYDKPNDRTTRNDHFGDLASVRAGWRPRAARRTTGRRVTSGRASGSDCGRPTRVGGSGSTTGA